MLYGECRGSIPAIALLVPYDAGTIELWLVGMLSNGPGTYMKCRASAFTEQGIAHGPFLIGLFVSEQI